MKLIFLDIDDVLNCQEGYKSGECKYNSDGYQPFYSKNKYYVNKLIDETNAKIVISSTWRSDGLARMKEIWGLEQMSGEIIGITPLLLTYSDGITYSVPRGFEIEVYLKNMGFYHVNWSKEELKKYSDKSGVENYIIIDDNSDMLYGQRNNFVHCKFPNLTGFAEPQYKHALEILSKNIYD